MEKITPKTHIRKGLINLAMAGHQEIFKQHLMKNEEHTSFSKRYSAHFGAISTTYVAFCMSCLIPLIRVHQR